jgi:hypothetical protein
LAVLARSGRGSIVRPRGGAFDLATVLRFSELALSTLGEAREEIDALNVYPVPDGDTGTNMYLTFESARNAMLDAVGARPDDLPDLPDLPVQGDLGAALVAFARGALLGARGNSGVIFSQLVGAFCRRLLDSTSEDPSARCSPRPWSWPRRRATPRSASRSRGPSSPSPAPPPRPRRRRRPSGPRGSAT